MAIPSRSLMVRPVAADPLSQPELLLPTPGRALGLKRAFDFTVALVMFVFALPIIVLTLMLVRMTSRGPGLYSQIRLGRHGRPFAIYKVRTMRQDAERFSGAAWSVPGDSRITPVGRFLRATHLDELPQLWNVLRGDMSLVGPRPERPEFVPQLEQAIPYYRARLLVRPGVTGFAQVQSPPDSDLESVRLKLAYDIHYVRKQSFLFDVRICLATAFKMVGVPFGAIRRAFAFAARETVDNDYKNLAGDYARKKQSHKAPSAAEGSRDAQQPMTLDSMLDPVRS
jgi:lipopolysaccharide/colanic/teichoic acid biosynthesis glycosyltransferase